MYVQVSFSEEHKKLPAGTYTVRFFDDDLYAILRKVWLLLISFDNDLYVALFYENFLCWIKQNMTRDTFDEN